METQQKQTKFSSQGMEKELGERLAAQYGLPEDKVIRVINDIVDYYELKFDEATVAEETKMRLAEKADAENVAVKLGSEGIERYLDSHLLGKHPKLVLKALFSETYERLSGEDKQALTEQVATVYEDMVSQEIRNATAGDAPKKVEFSIDNFDCWYKIDGKKVLNIHTDEEKDFAWTVYAEDGAFLESGLVLKGTQVTEINVVMSVNRKLSTPSEGWSKISAPAWSKNEKI